MEILQTNALSDLETSAAPSTQMDLLSGPDCPGPAATASPDTPRLEGDAFPEGLELIPARMVNEYAYCPRLFYLMYVQKEWAHSADTLDGKLVHRRVDKPAGAVHTAEGLKEDEHFHARSIQVGSPRLGALAVVDVLEGEGAQVTPVDYKRSKAPDILEGAWEPERVQVCLQGLLLRENGYICDMAVIYYAGSKTRVDIPLTPALVSRTLELLKAAREAAHTDQLPRPLVDSPKCPRCSLVGICLPDEVNLLQAWSAAERAFVEPPPALPEEETIVPPEDDEDIEEPRDLAAWQPDAALAATLAKDRLPTETTPVSLARPLAEEVVVAGKKVVAKALEVRRLLPARDDRVPLYVQGQGYSLGLCGDVLEVREKGKKVESVRLLDLNQVSLFGHVQVSSQALRELTAREIVVTHLSYAGWIYAITMPMLHKNIMLRQRQYATAADPDACLALARRFVQGKIRNARTLLRRNGREVPEEVLKGLAQSRKEAEGAEGLEQLLGIEGSAARAYFSCFTLMFKGVDGLGFDFNGRNRRPPKDPVNALLSYTYALLVKDLIATLVGIGFDPFLGFYHQPRYGRPALALDLMEEFRPLVADSVVLGLINNGELSPGDFQLRAGACMLTDGGRKKVLEAYERRLDTLVSHPLFGYALSYRRVFEVQCRLLARLLQGELPGYEPFCTR